MGSEADRRAAAAATKDQRMAEQEYRLDCERSMRMIEHQRPLVERIEKKAREQQQELTQMLVAGRRVGLTWDDLAAAAHISRQAVQQRVNPLL